VKRVVPLVVVVESVKKQVSGVGQIVLVVSEVMVTVTIC
jgi:hypothetical protein